MVKYLQEEGDHEDLNSIRKPKVCSLDTTLGTLMKETTYSLEIFLDWESIEKLKPKNLLLESLDLSRQ